MLFSEQTQEHLKAMRLVENVSGLQKTTSWVWGGFTQDIYMGRILREHDDLDYLTLNLHQRKARFEETFASHGWQTKDLANGDLKLKKDDIKIQLGNVELGQIATWTHNGEKGSLLFPVTWLSFDAVEFYGMELHVVSPELQYVLKEHPELMNPDWLTREKDILDRQYLHDILVRKGVDVCSLYKLVKSV